MPRDTLSYPAGPGTCSFWNLWLAVGATGERGAMGKRDSKGQGWVMGAIPRWRAEPLWLPPMNSDDGEMLVEGFLNLSSLVLLGKCDLI